MNFKNIILAIILFMFFSLSSVFMKYASLSSTIFNTALYYGLSMLTLACFAFMWQKLLVKYNLSRVYIFKSTTIIWGMIFGYVLFNEVININMIIGSIITIIGVSIIMVKDSSD